MVWDFLQRYCNMLMKGNRMHGVRGPFVTDFSYLIQPLVFLYGREGHLIMQIE